MSKRQMAVLIATGGFVLCGFAIGRFTGGDLLAGVLLGLAGLFVLSAAVSEVRG